MYSKPNVNGFDNPINHPTDFAGNIFRESQAENQNAMYGNELLNQNEHLIIEQLANGSNMAFKALFHRHKDRIYRLAMRYLKCDAQAQEVVQDVFMKLWIHREDINRDKPLEAWLYTVGKNNILNKIKRQANVWKAMEQLKKTQNLEDDSMQEKFQYADYGSMLENTLDTLSQKQLEVFTLARKEHLTYVQIADQLKISPLTVKTHMSRALCHIRAVLTPLICA
ncbi:RNA polymerase sigma-70 factor [Pedobacter frigiditerrae]|uniref:RNA polymerase sigma-70 factor n=1 Tax=Pedobacter frigiditerrae TaxID=2530452 RepID=A0A4R0MP17_9SPHI|nr:RNA polymerase sigma-70 factor [Pedobacter frigiditerrae]